MEGDERTHATPSISLVQSGDGDSTGVSSMEGSVPVVSLSEEQRDQPPSHLSVRKHAGSIQHAVNTASADECAFLKQSFDTNTHHTRPIPWFLQ